MNYYVVSWDFDTMTKTYDSKATAAREFFKNELACEASQTCWVLHTTKILDDVKNDFENHVWSQAKVGKWDDGDIVTIARCTGHIYCSKSDNQKCISGLRDRLRDYIRKFIETEVMAKQKR